MTKNTSSYRLKVRNKIFFKIFAATCYLIKCVCSHVQHDRPIKNTAPQFKQTVQRQSCYIRLAPSIAAIFNILFKLQPPETHSHTHIYVSPGRKLWQAIPLFHVAEAWNRTGNPIKSRQLSFSLTAQLINIFIRL